MCIGQPRPGYFCHILVQPLFRISRFENRLQLIGLPHSETYVRTSFFFACTHTRAPLHFESVFFSKLV